jgi:5'-3' exonuclease
MKYLLVDAANLFFRIRHTAHRGASLDDKLGLSMHTLFTSISKSVRLFNVDHVMFALEGRSWRKDVYAPYKKPRAEQKQARTEEEQEEDELYWETFNEVTKYLKEHTNCTVLREPNAEADDLIAQWIFVHPEDEHVILSSDTDFYQLLTDKVSQYNGITKEHITVNGVWNDNGTPVIDKKTQAQKVIGDPEWLLFEKCIRGDSSDNIFSAYPGVRKKGSKNKVGLLEAFADKEKKGFAWNNLMLQRWSDQDEQEHRVLDDYERNKKLIDLTQAPKEIEEAIMDEIENTTSVDAVTREPTNKVSFHFMKFCGRHDLPRLAEHPQDTVRWIVKPYPGTVEDLRKNRSWTKLKQKQL